MSGGCGFRHGDRHPASRSSATPRAPSHVELVRANWAAFAHGDIPAVLAVFAEDATPVATWLLARPGALARLSI